MFNSYSETNKQTKITFHKIAVTRATDCRIFSRRLESTCVTLDSIPSCDGSQWVGRAGWPLSDDKGAREKTNCLQRTKGEQEQQEDEEEAEEEEEEEDRGE